MNVHSRRASRHLSEEEVVDVIERGDGHLSPDRRSHLRECDSCRRQVDELRAVLLEAGDVSLPEPSPLFWKHLSARVSEAVVADDPGTEATWWGRWGVSHVATALSTAAVVLAVVVGLPYLDSRIGGEAPGGATDQGGVVEPVDPGDRMELAPLDESPDWALLLQMADTVEWTDGEVELLVFDGGAISDVVLELTADERRTLAHLLAAELQDGEL